MRSANPHRQLNEEETRLYAAGMAAHRRGETVPAVRLPPEKYVFWAMGWRRVGRGVTPVVPHRSQDHNTKCEGIHCIHTEAETLDDALKILEIQQRDKKRREARAANAGPLTWQQELRRYHQGRGVQRFMAKQRAELPAPDQRYSDLEQRTVEHIEAAINALAFAIEEGTGVQAMTRRYLALNPKNLADIINRLCFLIGRPAYDFAAPRQKIAKALRYCVNCGAELLRDEQEFCFHCRPENEAVRIASEERRAQAGELTVMKREYKGLRKLIDNVEEAIDGLNRNDGGHPPQATGSLGPSGCEDDHDVGGEAAHRPGEGDPGNDQSRDSGGAPGAEPRPDDHGEGRG